MGAVTNIVMGISSFVMGGLRGLWKALTSVTKIYTATIWLAQKAVLIWNITLGALRGILLAVRMAAILAGVGINFMSWPILLIIGALRVISCWIIWVVWIGSGTINVAQLMLDTLDVVKELAEQTASHTHSNTGAPTNAGAIRSTGAKADTLNGKYSPVIGK